MPDASSNFNTLAQQSQNLLAQQQQLQQQRRQVHHEMKQHLVRTLQAVHQAFDGLRNLEDEDMQIPGERDVLESWSIEEDLLEATFGYSFRGEYHYYEVRLPLRYLQPDGLEQVQAEARALREAQAQKQRLEQQEAVERDRRLYETLRARFAGEPAQEDQP